MHFFFSPLYSNYKEDLERFLINFNNEGTLIGTEKRNIVKFIRIDDVSFNVKSFRKATFTNKFIYKFFRKTKAQRSFEYAQELISKGINTPSPVAYLNDYNLFGLSSSYYISLQMEDCFMLSDVIENPFFHDRENIIRRYTRLIYKLHNNGIEFKDNSSGNFLIRKTEKDYHFYIVDLNRMNFSKKMSIPHRLANFSRISNDLEVIKIISDEYAFLAKIDLSYAMETISYHASKFRRKSKLKQHLKQTLLNWLRMKMFATGFIDLIIQAG